MRTRDPLAERILLDRSQRLGRVVVANWPAVVERRLADAQETHGDAWADRSARELVTEADDEAIDLAAWLTLAIQALTVDPETTATVGELIAQAIAAAGEAHALLVAAQKHLRRAEP